MMSVAGKRMGMMKTGTVWGVICGLALWLFAGLFSCAMAANVSCNYASSGGANTQCVVASEMWLGISKMYASPYSSSSSNELVVTTNDGRTAYLKYVAEMFGDGLPTPPVCNVLCTTWNMNQGERMVIRIVYSCAGVANCGGNVNKDIILTYAGGTTPVKTTGKESSWTYYKYTRWWSGPYANCTEEGTILATTQHWKNSGEGYTYNCSMNIPVGQLFIDTYGLSLSPVNSYNGGNWTVVGIQVGSDYDSRLTYGYVISQPWASCDSPGVSSYVFEATGTANYAIHSRSKQDSVAVKLVPKQHISNCTHNVYSWAGSDGWYHTTAKLAVKSETSSCDKNVSNAYSTVMNGSDVNINWTISGLSTLAAGTQVNCTHNLVTELTWY